MRKTGRSEATPVMIDTCGWIEYLSDGAKAVHYARYIESRRPMVTSPIIVYEVYKRLRMAYDEDLALKAIAHIQDRASMVVFDGMLAVAAADISAMRHLPMADAIILATAESKGAQLVTGDGHFLSLEGVSFV